MEQIKWRRRTFLATSACGIATGVGGAVSLRLWGRAPLGPWRALSPDEVRLVEAVSEQIIPGDRDPGAREAGVARFIDRQLDGFYRRFANLYHRGLLSLDQTSRAMFGNAFVNLDWCDQTRVLQEMESGRVPKHLWPEPSSRRFFALIRDHVMQGFYGSPRHGGNRNYASYRMMDLEYPRVIGQNRYGK